MLKNKTLALASLPTSRQPSGIYGTSLTIKLSNRNTILKRCLCFLVKAEKYFSLLLELNLCVHVFFQWRRSLEQSCFCFCVVFCTRGLLWQCDAGLKSNQLNIMCVKAWRIFFLFFFALDIYKNKHKLWKELTFKLFVTIKYT